MMDLNQALAFVRVVQAGSFTRAAKELGTRKSTVSRAVSQLEERLGARLLHRTTRSLSLTEVGQGYYERCARLVTEMEDAERSVAEVQKTPRGLLRVTAPLRFGFLAPVLAELLTRHPQLELEFICSDRVHDLVEERIDVAIRVGSLGDSSLIATLLSRGVPLYVVAAPSYLARRGVPTTPKALHAHDCLMFRAGKVVRPWLLREGDKIIEVPVRGRLASNEGQVLKQAALAGLGIAHLPAPLCVDEIRKKKLKRLLAAWSSIDIPTHAVYPSTRHLSPAVRAFIDLLQKRYPQALERRARMSD